MSRTLTKVGPTLRKDAVGDEQRRRLTRPESRLAARGRSGLTHLCGSTHALRSVVREEGCADAARKVRLVENFSGESLGGGAEQAVEGGCSMYPHPSPPDRLVLET